MGLAVKIQLEKKKTQLDTQKGHSVNAESVGQFLLELGSWEFI